MTGGAQMPSSLFTYQSEINAEAAEVFNWHMQPGAFKRLLPEWEKVDLVNESGQIANNKEVELTIKLGFVQIPWSLKHHDYIQNKQFCDAQLNGPFSNWDHHHIFHSLSTEKSILEEKIHYKLPLSAVTNIFAGGFVKNKLERLFKFRHQTTINDIKRHSLAKGVKMKILVSGSTGLVGSALMPFLSTGGHDCYRLVRKASSNPKEISWDPQHGKINPNDLEGFDAIIHLGGENIADKRWSQKQKELIKTSRVESTQLLAETITKLQQPPKVFVCASAIGFYGSRASENLDESSLVGSDFLASTCQAWEQASKAVQDKGIRLANMRFGIILSTKGGAIAKMLLPFQLGVGGILGNGKQYMSWIALDDVVGALHHALITEQLSGPVNVVAPGAMTNSDFTKVLGKVLFRPTLFPAPAFALKLALGEMAEALLLSSTRVEPKALVDSGFEFNFPKLEPALRHILGK